MVDLPMLLWMWGWQDGRMVRSEWRWRWWTGGRRVGPVGGGGLHVGWWPGIRTQPKGEISSEISQLAHSLQSDSCVDRNGKALTNVNPPLQPADCWWDCSHDTLLWKTRTNMRKWRNSSFLSGDSHVFTSSPGRVQQKFTAHTIPPQPPSPAPQTLKQSKLQPWWKHNKPQLIECYSIKMLCHPPSGVFTVKTEVCFDNTVFHNTVFIPHWLLTSQNLSFCNKWLLVWKVGYQNVRHLLRRVKINVVHNSSQKRGSPESKLCKFKQSLCRRWCR